MLWICCLKQICPFSRNICTFVHFPPFYGDLLERWQPSTLNNRRSHLNVTMIRRVWVCLFTCIADIFERKKANRILGETKAFEVNLRFSKTKKTEAGELRWHLVLEFVSPGSQRAVTVVKITLILSVRNASRLLTQSLTTKLKRLHQGLMCTETFFFSKMKSYGVARLIQDSGVPETSITHKTRHSVCLSGSHWSAEKRLHPFD